MELNFSKLEQIVTTLQKLDLSDQALFQLGHNVLTKSAEWLHLVKMCLSLVLTEASIDLIICYVYNSEEYIQLVSTDRSIEILLQNINKIENENKITTLEESFEFSPKRANSQS